MEALFRRFPGLRELIPRVDLSVTETPVEEHVLNGVSILIKRDDLSAPLLGGNKVRSLELLLAGARPSDTLLTVGSAGSTHALAVAQYGSKLGVQKEIITWPQEWSDVSRATAHLLKRRATVLRSGSPFAAYVQAIRRRLRGGVHWVPAGGSTALGALAHVSAALEMVDQLEASTGGAPTEIIVPLGSGGTTAGLLAGLSIAQVSTRLLAVRVVSRLVGNRWRVLRLARQTRALLQRLTREQLPAVDGRRLEIHHEAFGGAYGRETRDAASARAILAEHTGVLLDATYSAKAFAVALARAKQDPTGRTLFWLTFDGRWLNVGEETPRVLRTSSKRRPTDV